jgi:hypothetical protein
MRFKRIKALLAGFAVIGALAGAIGLPLAVSAAGTEAPADLAICWYRHC